jgi:hypothetical protein
VTQAARFRELLRHDGTIVARPTVPASCCTWLKERHAETQFFEPDPCRGLSSTSARARRREGPRVCRLAAGGSRIRTVGPARHELSWRALSLGIR